MPAEPLVLLYHSIAEVPGDPLRVSPERFGEQLDVLKELTEPVPLRDLAHRGPSPRHVAVTFDDGYADNLTTARPALERRGIPATIFVATGALRSGAEFWWDELERLAPGSRRELGDGFKRLLPEERDEVLTELRESRPGAPDPPPSHRLLTPAELVALADGGLVEIGAHTVTHPRLSELPVEAQEAEIVESRRELEELLGRPVRGFAYPYGEAGDYGYGTVALVKASGFDHACSVGHRVSALPRLEILRKHILDWPADEFERRLSGWLSV